MIWIEPPHDGAASGYSVDGPGGSDPERDLPKPYDPGAAVDPRTIKLKSSVC